MFQQELQIWHVLPPGAMKGEPSLIRNVVLGCSKRSQDIGRRSDSRDCGYVNRERRNRPRCNRRAWSSYLEGSPKWCCRKAGSRKAGRTSCGGHCRKRNDYPARNLQKCRAAQEDDNCIIVASCPLYFLYCC
jgi:rubredoxin